MFEVNCMIIDYDISKINSDFSTINSNISTLTADINNHEADTTIHYQKFNTITEMENAAVSSKAIYDALKAVKVEEIVAAAKRMQLDTIYFLKGEDK